MIFLNSDFLCFYIIFFFFISLLLKETIGHYTVFPAQIIPSFDFQRLIKLLEVSEMTLNEKTCSMTQSWEKWFLHFFFFVFVFQFCFRVVTIFIIYYFSYNWKWCGYSSWLPPKPLLRASPSFITTNCSNMT